MPTTKFLIEACCKTNLTIRCCLPQPACYLKNEYLSNCFIGVNDPLCKLNESIVLNSVYISTNLLERLYVQIFETESNGTKRF